MKHHSNTHRTHFSHTLINSTQAIHSWNSLFHTHTRHTNTHAYIYILNSPSEWFILYRWFTDSNRQIFSHSFVHNLEFYMFLHFERSVRAGLCTYKCVKLNKLKIKTQTELLAVTIFYGGYSVHCDAVEQHHLLLGICWQCSLFLP